MNEGEYMNRIFKSMIISLALIASSFASMVPLTSPVSATTGAECTDNAVVRCGVYSLASMRTAYKGDVKAAYNYFGITDGMVSGTTATIKEGQVNRNGNVIVDGNVIATGAITAGRHDRTGSTQFTAGGSTFYQRPASVGLVSDTTLEAYVMVDKNGQFLGAVLKPCGNPVKATPKVVKVPAAACTAVTAHKLTRTTYRFTGTASVKDGATISAYVFAVKGPSATNTYTVNSTTTTATTPTVPVTAGTHTVTLTVKTSLGDKTGANCATTFKVEEEPKTPPVVVTKTVVCNPATGQTITVEEKEAKNYKPVGDVACQPKVESATTEKVEVIASTGPGEILGGVAGLGSLTAAGYYLRASRQRLIDTIKR